MGVKSGQYTGKDPWGNPIWGQWKDPYGKTGRQTGLEYAKTFSEGGRFDVSRPGVRRRDEIAKEWLLDPDQDYRTRWRLSMTEDAHSGWDNPQQKDKRGYEWGRARQNPYAPGIRMSDWFVPIKPGERADLTTGQFRTPYVDPQTSQSIRDPRRPYDYWKKIGAQEVIDWEDYDRAGKEYLAATGKRKFKTLDEIHEFHKAEKIGIQTWKAQQAAERARLEAEAEKARQKAEAERREALKPKPLDVGQNNQGVTIQPITQQPQQIAWNQTPEYKQLTSQIAALTGQLGGLQGQYSGLQGKYSGLQGQYGGLQGQFQGLQSQHAAAQQQHQAALANWLAQSKGYQGQIASGQKTIQDLQSAAAQQQQRNRVHNAWMSGQLGQGAGGVKHAMFIRPEAELGWTPASGLGREGSRITTGGINI